MTGGLSPSGKLVSRVGTATWQLATARRAGFYSGWFQLLRGMREGARGEPGRQQAGATTLRFAVAVVKLMSPEKHET